MIEIGDQIKINWIDPITRRRNKNLWTEFTGKVIAITRYVIVLQKDNGVRESFNFSQLIDENLKVMKRVDKSYEVLGYQEISKRFEVNKL